ncbi:MAG: hypothetical protein KC475_03415 [Cyanobacteria bacterium HKST-UBA03]|nr:hypothetical protein [Cyanobacteria bacterium HKST-UBA03]
MIDAIKQAFETMVLAESGPLYDRLTAFRSWFNAHVANYELYLEDEWYDGYTVIEYLLRSLDTLSSSAALAGDRYSNQRDAKGVWHLGTYRDTVWLSVATDTTTDTDTHVWAVIQAFFEENGPPNPKI